MSKYNHMKSISFSELKEGEIEQAIREWSQENIKYEECFSGDTEKNKKNVKSVEEDLI